MPSIHSIVSGALAGQPVQWLAALCLACLAGPASAFSLVDTEGHAHRLADYQGKWVLVNFWAPWCTPCLAEIPDLQALHDTPANQLVVLGVALEYSSPEQVLKFAKRHDMRYPVILGTLESARQIGPVDALPASYLYNPKGKIVAYNVGALTQGAVERYIQSKREQPSAP